MVLLSFVSFIGALVVALIIMRRVWRHAAGYGHDKPQRFHLGHVPRLGGIAVLGGLACGWVAAGLAGLFRDPINASVDPMQAFYWLLVALPATLGGAYEDVTQRLSVRYRLVLTAISAGLGCWLLGLSIGRLGLPWVDDFILTTPWLGIALAIFAICGLPHAFNIIDGYNGLAGTVAVLVCAALAHVSLQVGDRQLAAFVICLAGATAGFLVWNYPRGLIFAGDGGAYLWGVVIAVGAVLLVQRHSQVSPWFPMLLLIYPVWETVFSIYRKLARGYSPGVADALHFHQLIYRRIVRGVFDDNVSRRMLVRNNRTSPYLWSFTLLTVAPAVLFWSNTLVLMLFCGLFATTYVAAYLMIVRFKVPRWLKR
jgi:UDP-N-acetylmuramyl pentapeptide phosphotransferase/UDP-N-acetylglucosamine-1-phosphate transferase